jgi:hypothetical protein
MHWAIAIVDVEDRDPGLMPSQVSLTWFALCTSDFVILKHYILPASELVAWFVASVVNSLSLVRDNLISACQ